MAQQTTRRASRKSSGSSGSKGSQSKRRAPRKSGQGGNGSGDGSRRSPFRNQTDESTVPEREYRDYTLLHPGSIGDTDEPDVLVDIPVVNVDEIHFELDRLEARVSLHAEVLDLVKLSVGVHAELGKVELSIKGVEAQALLRARLDHVTAIVDRVLTTLDRNPKLLESIGRSVEKVGAGAGKGVGQIGQGTNGLTAKLLAKEAAKTVVKEIGAAATDEAKDLGLAATHKAMELGERRRQKRAMKHHATEAALREAESAGLDLEAVEGSGAEGRITVRDVKSAGSG